MALLSLITEQSTVQWLPTIPLLLGDHFGVDKKTSGDHFGVGIISGSIWGSFQGWGSFRGRDHFGGCTDTLLTASGTAYKLTGIKQILGMTRIGIRRGQQSSECLWSLSIAESQKRKTGLSSNSSIQ